ncbi:hypothetical protein QMK19_41185 [Streptomyces sp. H10-C2]|uniref:hypothetical protein n=1 Tax=unclassified Streptomyces TaxID=2593676 RepID=UPI0024B99E8D|nr:MULTISPECIES: hypothetical protein [unclassified Streptomyces]MDJ0347639.1 hypothetical protein [Streptomyces sp. PH10-H1]MDJ0375810.1 hypothetical protein [Streptomyces sp. H10-C2]
MPAVLADDAVAMDLGGSVNGDSRVVCAGADRIRAHLVLLGVMERVHTSDRKDRQHWQQFIAYGRER